MARVRPLESDGEISATKSCGALSSRVMPVTPPPGPVSVTWNTRTVPPGPGMMVEGFGAVLNVVLHGAVVEKPSSAFIATFGSLRLFGLATGMFKVRSVVPDNSRLVGNGTTALVGSKRAVMTAVTGEPPLLLAPASDPCGALLPPPQADNRSDEERARSKLSRVCMTKS